MKVPSLQVVLNLAAAVLLLLLGIAAFVSPTGAWPLCIAAIACATIANLDRFTEISASTTGVKVLLRDARAQLEQLRRIARLSASAGLALIQRAGWSGGFTDDEKASFLNETKDILRDAGMGENEIAEIQRKSWDKYVIYDYVIATTGGSIIPDDSSPDLYRKWEKVRDFDNPASPDELEAFFKEQGCLNGLRQELLAEYRFYVAHRRHHNIDIWKQRDAVPPIPVRRSK